MKDPADYLAHIRSLIILNPQVAQWQIVRETIEDDLGLFRYRLTSSDGSLFEMFEHFQIVTGEVNVSKYSFHWQSSDGQLRKRWDNAAHTIWIIGAVFVVLLLLVVSIIITDGRYFGKQLVFWIYDRFGAAARWQQLAGLLALQGDEPILDVGTAVANLPFTLAGQPNFQGHIIGLDWSPKMLATAQRRGLSQRISLVRGDARRPLPFVSQSFNVITCLETLETLSHPEQILDEIIRILRPDGILVFSLYKGILSLTAALGFDRYQKQLQSSSFNLQLVQFRQNYDIVIGLR